MRFYTAAILAATVAAQTTNTTKNTTNTTNTTAPTTTTTTTATTTAADAASTTSAVDKQMLESFSMMTVADVEMMKKTLSQMDADAKKDFDAMVAWA